MKQSIQLSLQELKSSLSVMQDCIIGYAKVGGQLEAVIDIIPVENTKCRVKTIFVTKSFGFKSTSIELEDSEVYLFPNEETLTTMMLDPFRFNEWHKENKI